MSPLKSLSVALFVFASACLGMGFGTKEVRLSSTSNGVPAARGAVRTGDAANNNTSVVVRVEHLAEPERVSNGATTYVVWAQRDGTKVIQNIGALRVDEKLNGSLSTVLPFDDFKVFITAEPASNVTGPSGEELLTANIRRR